MLISVDFIVCHNFILNNIEAKNNLIIMITTFTTIFNTITAKVSKFFIWHFKVKLSKDVTRETLLHGGSS